MKWGWAAAIVFLVLSLAACVQDEAVLGESTTVPTPPPTIEPTATETAVPTRTTPSRTPLPTLMITPESLMLFEPGPDGQPYPAIPISNTDISNYELTEPDAAILFQILLLTMRETCNYDHESYYFIN